LAGDIKEKMKNKTWKVDLTALSKKELAGMIESFCHSTYAVDGLWFQAVEKLLGTETAIKLDKEVWSKAGFGEAHRLKKLTEIKNDLYGLAKAFNLHSMFQVTEYDVSMHSYEILVFTVTNCKMQKARIKKGLGEFACKDVGIACMEGFSKGINPDSKVKCVTCPPDRHPDNLWCQWEFTID